MIVAKTHFGLRRNYMTLQLAELLPDKPGTVIVVTTKNITKGKTDPRVEFSLPK